jgi:hypothetical protein
VPGSRPSVISLGRKNKYVNYAMAACGIFKKTALIRATTYYFFILI